MRGCGVFTGILFSRKLCPQPAVTKCGRCATPLCKQHVRPQVRGRFLCPSCDAYENDDDWRYSNRDNDWHYRDRSRPADGAPAAAAGAVVAGDLADEDKAGLSTNAAGAWHGPDDTAADDAADADGDADGGFDAS
jgi:hypothetical protein